MKGFMRLLHTREAIQMGEGNDIKQLVGGQIGS